jgi:hypothetical protein
MTLLSSAKSIGFDMEFIFRGRAFIYIMNNKGPRIDPWGTQCFSVPQSEKTFRAALRDFISTFCLLLVKQGLNQSAVSP